MVLREVLKPLLLAETEAATWVVPSETEDVEDGEREEAVADVVGVESIVEVKGVGVWIVDL